MQTVGTEWLIDATGCDAAALCDMERMRAVFDRVVCDLNLHVVGVAQWHQFPPPGGITGLALLSESHLACHTYPELGVATINLYCCRARPAWEWDARLREMLGATEVIIRVVERAHLASISIDINRAVELNEAARSISRRGGKL